MPNKFIGHYCAQSYTRQAKGGLTFKTFYFTHIPPSSQIGMPGDFYILQDAPTVFWKEDRWRPWTWDVRVEHPSHDAYVLNFDLRGPVWSYSSGTTVIQPSFNDMMDAISHFNHVVKTKSNLGSKSKPIVVDWSTFNLLWSVLLLTLGSCRAFTLGSLFLYIVVWSLVSWIPSYIDCFI